MKTTIDAMKYALDIISRTTSSAFVKTMLEEAIAHEEAQTVDPVAYGVVRDGKYGSWAYSVKKWAEDAAINGYEVCEYFTRPVPATESMQVTCQIYGNVVGACGECNTHSKPSKLPENCGTGHCSCIECLKPAKPSAGEREALIHWLRERSMWDGMLRLGDAADMLAADALEIEQTCNCRFVGEINTVQCTLHNAWAETLNEQSGYRKELHTLKAQQVVVPQDKQCDLSYVHGLQRGHTLGHMGLDEQYAIEMNAYRREIAAAPQPPQANAQKSGDAHEIWATAQLAPGEGIEDGVARVEALLDAPRVPMTSFEMETASRSPHTYAIYGGAFKAGIRAAEIHHGIGVKS